MQRANVSDADLMEVADQVDGREASFATAMTKRAREGFAELKSAGMNSKRRERSNTSMRVFKTYTEADIRDAPHDNCVRAESFERRNDWKLVELKPWVTHTSSPPTRGHRSCSATTASLSEASSPACRRCAARSEETQRQMDRYWFPQLLQMLVERRASAVNVDDVTPAAPRCPPAAHVVIVSRSAPLVT
uniref:Uncharacterized protein n=1 Tax=Haptolina ericina TaxID=156174 RepID=A0A7S3ASF0_9EUKA|mmetsp:Transcript_29556/g.66885  ORF Transcript_29556/g.66885 Transcript_29556/m.66885 type:complete len:190 (+) Transcript_29556:618-1187(+)